MASPGKAKKLHGVGLASRLMRHRAPAVRVGYLGVYVGRDQCRGAFYQFAHQLKAVGQARPLAGFALRSGFGPQCLE